MNTSLNIIDRKFKLIQEIINLNNENLLFKLEKEIKSSERFWSSIKPIRKSVTIQEMIAEQNYSPIKKESFYKKVSRIKIEEPLEQLLSMAKQ